MIENILIYMILACIVYVTNDMRKIKDDWYVQRESDATIEYIAGSPVLKEK